MFPEDFIPHNLNRPVDISGRRACHVEDDVIAGGTHLIPQVYSSYERLRFS